MAFLEWIVVGHGQARCFSRRWENLNCSSFELCRGNTAAAGQPTQWTQLQNVWVLIGTKELILQEELDALRDAIQNEIAGAADACEYPFSQGLEDFWGSKKRSLVHSLAPLTHWPARMSEQALRLSWFLGVGDPVAAGCQEFACFPDFQIAQAPGADAVQRPNKPVAHTGNLTGGAKLELMSVYSDGRDLSEGDIPPELVGNLVKARSRRVLLPEAELGALVTAAAGIYRLSNRIEGAEVIPPDLAIDVDGAPINASPP